MHSALVILDQPDRAASSQHQLWEGAVGKIARAAEDNTSQIEALAPGCVLVHLSQGPHTLAQVVSYAQGQPCRVLFFDKEPQWVRSTQKSA